MTEATSVDTTSHRGAMIRRLVVAAVVAVMTAMPIAATAPAASADTVQVSSARTYAGARYQAMATARDYLAYQGFSRKGLIKQLQFEGFSYRTSVYAVDHITVSWYRQAVRVAKAYLDYSHFSRSGLIQQLVFEGFTSAQATYGVNRAY